MASRRREVTTQATPLARDVLGDLRSMLEGGGLEQAGLGISPLQREAGTAARQFVSSGGGRFDLSPLLGQLEDIQRRRVAETTGNLRESFGAMGARFGSPLATAEGRTRRELETEFGAQTGELLRQEFGAQQQRQLQGIGLLQSLGVSNLAPFFQMAQLGIQPDVFEPSPFVQGLSALGGALGGAGAVRSAFG